MERQYTLTSNGAGATRHGAGDGRLRVRVNPAGAVQWGEGTEVGQPAWLSIANMAGGMLGILSLSVGQKHMLAGRIMAGLAGLIVLSGLLAMRELTTLSLQLRGGSGVLLLLAAPFVGQMPSPQEERMERHAR